jgi:hypothetical protein
LQYLPITNILRVVTRFGKFHGEADIESHFNVWGLNAFDDEAAEDDCPFHFDTIVEGSRITAINKRK